MNACLCCMRVEANLHQDTRSPESRLSRGGLGPSVMHQVSLRPPWETDGYHMLACPFKYSCKYISIGAASFVAVRLSGAKPDMSIVPTPWLCE